MPAPKYSVIVGKRDHSVLDDLVIIDGVGFLVGDVQVIAARQPDTQHNACHPRSVGLLAISCHPVRWNTQNRWTRSGFR